MKSIYNNCSGLLFIILFFTLFSCRKEPVAKVEEPQTTVMSVQDSASYIINGKQYYCDRIDSWGWGNTKANKDSVTGQWDKDTITYFSQFALSRKTAGNENAAGYIKISFIKKFDQKDLNSSSISMFSPRKISDHYFLGKYPYALDFEKTNRQNGVKLEVWHFDGNIGEAVESQSLTNPAKNYQSNSDFEIKKFTSLPGTDTYILEARFAFNGYSPNGNSQRVTDGYLRVKIR